MIAPTLPSAKSMQGRTLARLLQARKISHIDMLREVASYRLSAPIERLRNLHGWQIEIEYREGITRDSVGRKARYGVYSIAPELIRQYRKALGAERFDNFIESVKKFENQKI
jgi:hypothetical protein